MHYDLSYPAEVVGWFRDRADEHARRSAPFIRKTEKLDDRFLALHEPLIEPRTVAVVQDLAGEVESVKLGRTAFRYLPTKQKSRQRCKRIVPLFIVVRDFGRLGHVNRRRLGLSRNV